jgi:serine protease AprX
LKATKIAADIITRRLRRFGQLIRLCVLLACSSGVGSLPANADRVTAKSDQFLVTKYHAATRPTFTNVIIRTQGVLTGKQESQLKALGGHITGRLPLIHAVVARIPTARLKALADMPFITHLSEDVVTHKHDEFTVHSTGADVAFQQYGLTGNGITVAVLDSGITQHPDLTNNDGSSCILANVSFVPNDPSPQDACGHGTHVAGIIAGNGSASSADNCYRTFYGMARTANLVNVRVLDSNGQGTVSTVINGIQWCIQNQVAYNIRVINLSLGHPVGESYANDPLCQAVEQAWQAGIVVVCAAGNDGRLNTNQTTIRDNEGWGTAYNTINVPGNDPFVITVGATKTGYGPRAYDRIASYSSRGPTAVDFILKPDIVAPGNRVISLRCINSTLDLLYGATNTVPLNSYMNNASDSDTPQYFRLSGTSMATPVVTGAAALLLDADPTLTPDTIKARLMITADKWRLCGGLYDPCTFGAGYLDIPAALACTVVANQPAISPTLVSDGAQGVYLNQITWGKQIIWGTGINDLSIIWGTQVIWGCNVIWNANVNWGVQGTQIIWGGGGTSNVGATGINMTSIYGED